jgi:poly(hydroxyalkanoate) granule-associated protein
MATEVKEPAPEESKEEHSQLVESLRKVLLAGIGAVALAQDEIEDFISRLVERGEIAEKEGKKLMNEVVDRRKKDGKKAEEEVTTRVEDALKRLNIPTKSDIDGLSNKIASLSKKIDELKKSQTQ